MKAENDSAGVAVKKKIEVPVPQWETPVEDAEVLPAGTYFVSAAVAGCSVRCQRPGLGLVDLYS